MTKEQILGNYYREHTETDKAIYEAMEHYKDQEVAKEREKAKKLVEALEECRLYLKLKDPNMSPIYCEVKSVLIEYKSNNH